MCTLYCVHARARPSRIRIRARHEATPSICAACATLPSAPTFWGAEAHAQESLTLDVTVGFPLIYRELGHAYYRNSIATLCQTRTRHGLVALAVGGAGDDYVC